MKHKLYLATVIQLTAACSDAEDLEKSIAALTCRNCTDLYIVAHQDDDLLFMNPDIHQSISAGNAVRVVYLTAGDANLGEAYYLNRELGMLAAYAAMAGRPVENWSSSVQTIGGRSLQVRTLDGAGVVLVFLRLPDPNLIDEPDLPGLWSGADAALTSRDGANTYTRGELTDTLHELMKHFAADRVSTLDSTGTETNDHEDHIASAFFALHAHHRFSRPHGFSIYAGYSISGRTENISTVEQNLKWNIFQTYAVHDPHVPRGACVRNQSYCEWSYRQVLVSEIHPGRGKIGTEDGRCLIAAGGAVDGAELGVGGCGSNALRWNTSDHQLSSGSLCATAASSNPSPHSGLTLTSCSNSATKKFTLTSNGQIRGPMGTCLVVAGDAAELVDCASGPSTDWSRQTGGPNFNSATGEFSDADIGTQATTAQSLRLGDLDGDGRADACIRKTTGIWCALSSAESDFSPYSRWTAHFSDSNGWAPEQYGTTIQLGDINKDGRADVCGRRADGIFCATANAAGTQFNGGSLRTEAFADGAWDDAAHSYRSIRFGDVDGDGAADLCGRRNNGAWCALNDGTGQFGLAVHWDSTEFTNARGWNTTETGATVQLGDVDGDGRSDMCGRREDGIYCAISTGNSFTGSHLWSLDNEFTASEGYWPAPQYALSIRLVDVDGDGAADICGRRNVGILCAISNGASFARKIAFMPRAFTDAEGWAAIEYSASIAFGDLDGNDRVDVCGRGPDGLHCALQ